MFCKKKTMLNEEQLNQINKMNEKDAKQSEYVKTAKEILNVWSKENNAIIHSLHDISGFGENLQIYIFYKTEAELNDNTKNWVVEETKKKFMQILNEIGYVDEFNDNVRFEFDSDENVKKNYKGNYFLRLR